MKLSQILLVLVCIIPLKSFTQTLPGWCDEIAYSKEFTGNENQRTNGVSYLLSDIQINLDSEEYFNRVVVKVNSEAGLSQISSLILNYDSTFQTADFIRVNIIRNGKVVNVLEKQKPEFLRREIGLEFGIMDGSISSYIEINDLRIGDILDYSMIVKGFNPIVKDYISFSFPTSFMVPVGKFHLSLTTSNPELYQYALENEAQEPKKLKTQNKTEYKWEINDPDIITVEHDIPAWYNPAPTIKFSKINNWNSIVESLVSLYTSKIDFSSEYKELVSEIKSKYSSKEEQARFAINYVQNSIRYLGNENGIYSFKPRHPNLILHKKSGDCKEKSWLLSCLLRDIGIESYPVLVNIFQGHTLEKEPESLVQFNHCVSCYMLGGDTLFVDPTFANQGGGIKDIFFPYYETGLIIKKGNSELTKIPMRNSGESIITEEFSFDDIKSPAVLNVTSVFTKNRADIQRSLLRNVSLNDIQSEYLKNYATAYPRIDTLCMLKVDDDVENNVIVLTQSYTLGNIWEARDTLNPNNVQTHFAARIIQDILRRDTYPARKSPMALEYPLNVTQIIIANLPHVWSIKEETNSISGDGFVFNSSVKYSNKRLELKYNYITNKSYVNNENYLDFVEKNVKIFNSLSYGLWHSNYNATSPGTNSSHPFYIILVVLIIGFGLLLAQKAYRYNPAVKNKYVNYNTPIGGWLIIPVIGIFFWTAFIVIGIFIRNAFNIELWLQFANQGSTQYQLISVHLVLQFVLNIFFAIFGILNIVLLLLKRSSFPIMMIVFHISYSMFIAFNQYVDMVYYNNNGLLILVIIFVANTFIWVPYFLRSERVKMTFNKTWKKLRTEVADGFVLQKEESNTGGHYQS